MSAMMDVLKALQAANASRDKEAVLALLTPDVEYHYHVGSRPLIGKEWVAKFLDRYWSSTADPLWRIDNHAENGDKLLVEGYDEYLDTQTGTRVSNPYMGILEFRGGKIARWRDYFQLQVTAPRSG
ncbi:MAG: nuclear transport factor 2 family protein, partial [Steroidobacteraceae bacterium]